jgi:hypothetical protein
MDVLRISFEDELYLIGFSNYYDARNTEDYFREQRTALCVVTDDSVMEMYKRGKEADGCIYLFFR